MSGPTNGPVKVGERVDQLKIHGNSEFVQGNYDKAIELYTTALSICPRYDKKMVSILYQNRAAAYSKLEKHDYCVADCDKALELVPDYRKAISRRARSLVETGNYKRALEDCSALSMLPGKEPTDILYTTIVLKKIGQINIEELRKFESFSMSSQNVIDNYLNSFSDDPFNDEFALSLMKSDANTGLEFALKCVKFKNFEGIERACIEELNKTDNNLIRRTLTLNLLATINLLCGKYATALECLTTIIGTPGVPKKLIINSLIKRASVYFQVEEFGKSYEEFEIAENIDPNCSDIFHHRAKQMFALELTEKAVENFKRAVELNPTFVLSNVEWCYAQYVYANKMFNTMNMKKFLSQLKDLFVCNNTNNAEIYRLYGKALVDKAMYKQMYVKEDSLLKNAAYLEADSLFKKAHEIYPDNATFLVYRAIVILSWKNSTSDALNYLQRALKLDPKCENAYNALGQFYGQKGELKEAIECFEKCIFMPYREKPPSFFFAFRDSIMAKKGVFERFPYMKEIIVHNDICIHL